MTPLPAFSPEPADLVARAAPAVVGVEDGRGQGSGVVLSADNFRQCYIPPGFAHGFCALSDTAEFGYKCTDFYDPTDELRIAWNDPEIGIAWPIPEPLLSDKDRAGQALAALWDQLPVYEAPR